MKYNFRNDYAEGCHPSVLKLLQETNYIQQEGYGMDDYSLKAKGLIKKAINIPQADVHFVTGGTQVNLIVIASILRAHEAVISVDTGHIFTNEAGAIEATGHKVCAIGSEDGKLNPDLIQSILDQNLNVPHVVKPRLVYISNSTEIGTIYSLSELKEISIFCKKNNLYLFLDGARLGCALTAESNDVTLEDIAKYTDIFYIGGTKNGALLGEAIVITNPNLKPDFMFHLKQKGALLSKGRILGIQFLALFTDNLFFELGAHANLMTLQIKNALADKHIPILVDAPTNQIFPILPNLKLEKLAEKFEFYVWKKIDEKHSAIRLVCSWNTQQIAVDSLIDQL